MPTPVFPHTETKSLDRWSNFSGTIQTGEVPVYATPLAVGADLTVTGALAPQADAVRAIIRHCFEQDLRLRPVGSRWSFSSILRPDRVMLDPAFLNGMLRIGPRSQTSDYADARGSQGLAPFWIQGGRTIATINQRLLERGFCLQTSGAGDGQRLAGALATGTHSSDLEVGALHDTVLGLHLIVGPDRAVFLQPSTRSALSDTFVDWLGGQTGMTIEHLRSDSLFRAAQVSLGSLGFVFSAVIEATPAYRFVRRVRRFDDRDDPSLWDAIRDLEVGALHPERASRPDHLDVVFHPYPSAGSTSAWLTTMWKTPAVGVAPAHAMPLPLAIASDVMSLIAGLVDALDGTSTTDLTTPILSEIILDQTESLYAEADIEAFPGQIFGTNNLPAGTGASTEIVVEHSRTEELIRCLYDVLDQHAARGEHLLGAIALRFVPRSPATLAMNIRPMNAYVELPSVRNEGTLAIFATLFDRLEAEGIPYTCHWGQQHGMNPTRLRTWFGHRVDAWRIARDDLLDTTGKAVFGAPILAEVGLD